MKLRLKVAPGHRYAEVSLRTRQGKIWLSKEQATTIDTDLLAPGEERVIQRYEDEGRLVVREVKASKRKAKPKAEPAAEEAEG